jgi:hypothetical protein
MCRRTRAVAVIGDERHVRARVASCCQRERAQLGGIAAWMLELQRHRSIASIECGTFSLQDQVLDRGWSSALEESFRAKQTVLRVCQCFGRDDMRWTVRERDVLKELLAAHADMERLTGEIMDARERRRDAARRLIDMGRGTSWIARHLDVSPQAVDAFLKYKQRKSQQ